MMKGGKAVYLTVPTVRTKQRRQLSNLLARHLWKKTTTMIMMTVTMIPNMTQKI